MIPIDVFHFKDADGRFCAFGYAAPLQADLEKVDRDTIILTIGGEPLKGLPDVTVHIPSAVFEQIVYWYQTQQEAPSEAEGTHMGLDVTPDLVAINAEPDGERRERMMHALEEKIADL